MIRLGVLGVDDSTVEQLIRYGVPGVVALVGVWLGRMWERRGATRRWRRDQRLDAYSRLLEAISKARDAGVRLWSRETPEARTYEANRIIEAEAPLYQLVARIELLGPDDVAAAADRAATKVMDATTDLIERVPSRQRDEKLANPLTDEAQQAHDTFVRAAKRSLR
jgi:hypothetical protein